MFFVLCCLVNTWVAFDRFACSFALACDLNKVVDLSAYVML